MNIKTVDTLKQVNLQSDANFAKTNTSSNKSASVFSGNNPSDNLQDGVIGSYEQGDLGNCWFLSGLTAMQQKDPNLVKKLITDNKNGTFTVNFLGAQKAIIVTEEEYKSGQLEIDGEEYAFSTGDKDVAILEIAASRALEKMRHLLLMVVL